MAEHWDIQIDEELPGAELETESGSDHSSDWANWSLLCADFVRAYGLEPSDFDQRRSVCYPRKLRPIRLETGRGK